MAYCSNLNLTSPLVAAILLEVGGRPEDLVEGYVLTPKFFDLFPEDLLRLRAARDLNCAFPVVDVRTGSGAGVTVITRS